jgi:hypothetical protein
LVDQINLKKRDQNEKLSVKVVKRDGRGEMVSFDKILRRITTLCQGLDAVEPVRVAARVVQGVHDGVHTTMLDELAAETAASLSSHHPDYARLAGNIAQDDHSFDSICTRLPCRGCKTIC